MTRVLILGNSHVGALRRGAGPFRARRPDLDLSFFAVPGATFLTGRVGEDGIFRPGFRNEDDRAMARQINDGAEQCDLTDFDRILVVGFRFSPLPVASLLITHDILGGGESGRPQLCSPAFLEACLADRIARERDMAQACLGPDRGYVLTLAPYPAESLVARSGRYEPARAFEALQAHPDGARVFALWKDMAEAAIAGLGYGYLPQPGDTLAGPLATRAEFARGGATAEGDRMAKTDHRHMNGAFGEHMLAALAEQFESQRPLAG